MGDLVTLVDHGFLSVRLRSAPGIITDNELDRIGSEITGEVWNETMAMVLGVVEVPFSRRVLDESIEALVLAGDCLGWISPDNVDGFLKPEG